MTGSYGSSICALILLNISMFSDGGFYDALNVGTERTTDPSTTKTPYGMYQWQVTDADEEVCMLIEMNGIIFDGITTTPIPQSARVTNRTSCADARKSTFELEWNDNVFITNRLGLHFRIFHGNYTLIKLEVSRKVLEGMHQIFIQRPRRSPSVPIGSSMSCADLNFNMVGFNDFKFQPFARLSNGTFGKDGDCFLVYVTPAGVYIGAAILVVVVFVIVTFLVFKIIQKVRKRRREKYEPL